MTVICQISAQFTDAGWAAPSPCPEWRVADLAGHLRCVADDFHEYLDDAPASRLARLMATGAHPDTLARKLARQNAAELAALPDASGPEHIAAFASSARAYAQRLLPIWDLPHHQYRDALVTVGGMAGRRLRRVAPARLGPGPGPGQGLPAGRPGHPAQRLAGREAAPAADPARGCRCRSAGPRRRTPETAWPGPGQAGPARGLGPRGPGIRGMRCCERRAGSLPGSSPADPGLFS